MPVKVRCPSCEKLLNAPDAARGKAIKCPGCETKIRVPVDDPASSSSGRTSRLSKASSTKRQPVDVPEEDILSSLDLSKAADTATQICTKCGAEIPDTARECPKCGVDPSTGRLSTAATKRSKRKGPDPSLYYGAVWTDGWAFIKTNMRLVVRTSFYWIVFGFMTAFCVFMVGYCDRLPPKVFWMGFGFAASLTIPGSLWHLTVEIVKLTLSRKTDASDIKFDTFQNIALGIKTIVWAIVFGCWFPFVGLMYPLAMVHMSMPVTKKAWLSPVILPIFFRTMGATLYWNIVAALTNLVVYVGPVLVAIFAGGMIVALNTAIQNSEWGAVAIGQWFLLTGVIIGGAVSIAAFAAVSIFNARGIGLLGYYFKDRLDLITLVEEKKYVSKGTSVSVTEQRRSFVHAGFWLRFVAAIVDQVILAAVSSGLGFAIGLVVGLMMQGGQTADPQIALWTMVGAGAMGFIMTWLYFAMLESSSMQATVGKMALGLVVTDVAGRPIGFGQATGRFFGKIVSGLIPFGIGYIAAAFTENKQAVHDLLAGTFVIKK